MCIWRTIPPSVCITYRPTSLLWPKIDHLLYQPILRVERLRCLCYYQGDGLGVIYDFTYKYMTLEHFLGQLTRMRVGAPLAEALAVRYVQAWYAGDDPVTIFVDWHSKPHWTKFYAHSGHVAMYARFNAANVRWRDGRLLRISIALPGEF